MTFELSLVPIVWGGGQNFPIQAFPFPYYYFDKYRALGMEIGQKMKASCATSDTKNSLGWCVIGRCRALHVICRCRAFQIPLFIPCVTFRPNCTIVPGCEHTVEHMQKAYAGSGTHIDTKQLSQQDFTW